MLLPGGFGFRTNFITIACEEVLEPEQQVVVRYTHEEHERIEYTPYGEVWIEKRNAEANGLDIPYRFTGKERDEETGLYYYGARYLDGKASMWLSADPALGDYIPSASVNDEARKRNGKLPGMGGVCSTR
jgi:RHS repeat-associated protein